MKESFEKDRADKSSVNDDRKKALGCYQELYIKHRTFFAGYFRMLYRICCTIDNAPKEIESHAKELLKILRSQLSGSELIFLWYDVNSPQGRDFRGLVHKYNILKHITVLDKLEYEKWSKELLPNNSVSDFLYILKKNIKKSLRSGKTETYSNKGNKANVSCISISELLITLHIDMEHEAEKSDLTNGLRILSQDSQSALIAHFLRDCFLLSPLYSYKEYREVYPNIIIKEETEPKSKEDGKSYNIVFSVKDIRGSQLQL